MLPGRDRGRSSGPPDVTGAVLAGGRAKRLGGGSKACVQLAGRPLLSYPLAALAGAVPARVAVVCKPSTALPVLPAGVERWEEPEEPSHPAVGIVQALESAGGPVLVVATDMPWVGARECRLLLCAASRRPAAVAVLASAGDGLQPAFGLYRPQALAALRAVARDEGPLTRAVEALAPATCELLAVALRGVNTPAELAAAERELALSGGAAARPRRR